MCAKWGQSRNFKVLWQVLRPVDLDIITLQQDLQTKSRVVDLVWGFRRQWGETIFQINSQSELIGNVMGLPITSDALWLNTWFAVCAHGMFWKIPSSWEVWSRPNIILFIKKNYFIFFGVKGKEKRTIIGLKIFFIPSFLLSALTPGTSSDSDSLWASIHCSLSSVRCLDSQLWQWSIF